MRDFRNQWIGLYIHYSLDEQYQGCLEEKPNLRNRKKYNPA